MVNKLAQAVHTSARPYAAFDIDGTIIRWQLFHAMMDQLAKRQLVDRTIYQAARLAWKKRTTDEAFVAYEQAMLKAYFASITSITPDELQEAASLAFEEHKDQVYRYTRQLLSDLKAKNYLLFAISRSNEPLVALLARHYAFDDYVGVQLIVNEQGKFTGQEVNHAGVSKRDLLNQLITKHQARQSDSIAIGDSEGDIDMLSVAETPIAFNPSQKLFAHAQAHQWRVVVERKNMIYTLEPQDNGYTLV